MHLQPLKHLLEGFKDITRPEIRSYIIWPLVINALVFFVLYGVSSYIFWDWFVTPDSTPEQTSWWAQTLGSIWTFLKALIAIFALVLWFLISGLISIITANIVGSPFNGLLSEKLEKQLQNTTFNQVPTMKLIKDSLLRELQKMGYYLPKLIVVAIVSLILGFIPLLNFLSPVILALFGAWIMALQYVDYPADNHQVPLDKLLQKMRNNRKDMLVFGFGCAFLSSVPLLNFVVMPACVLGATRFYLSLR